MTFFFPAVFVMILSAAHALVLTSKGLIPKAEMIKKPDEN